MKLQYETERLVLRILDEADADMTLEFYKKNGAFFAPFDPKYPDNFMTLEFQQSFLHAYLQQFLKQANLRYHLFLKNDPNRVIGCIGISRLHFGDDLSCQLSYKLDKESQHQGYATEAISYLLQMLSLELSIHRVEADILPDNLPSLHLAERLGFQYEGIAKSSHRINGTWMDHARFALILD